jgi:hypothetical protein
MKEPTRLDRREFTAEAVLAMLSGVVVTITACGGSGPSTPTPQPTPTPAPTPQPTPTPQATPTPNPEPTPTPAPTPTPMADKLGTVSANHGHIARITGAELTAAGAVVLDIHGTADHTHSVSLSAAEVVSIAANTQVSKVSSTDSSHNHTVTFN